ncbi:tissue factor pathway inhibitor 2 [Trichomycterus rosablanca]|uniref:tissue factor pathway inhibitor 2 n=1 Tax=Trichomycterus rosablanca TaxID=2290929 RepID=UPI002F35635C
MMKGYFIGGFLLINLFQNVFAVRSPHREVCLLQVDEGPCFEDVQRFYYNTITQRCERFSYGGCEGNQNNFKFYEECHKTCYSVPKIPRICRFPKEVGICKALLRRYFFNMSTMQCEQFFYGGCMGNENNFLDKKSCVDYCSPSKSVPVICNDVRDKGKCSASIPRYFYNSATKMCEEFVYTGCGGNANNFISKQSCLNVCAKKGKPWKPKIRTSTKTFQMRI